MNNSTLLMLGQKYGHLKVLSFAEKKKSRDYVNCLCDCGAEKSIQARSIRDGFTVSCGCYGKVQFQKWPEMLGKKYGRLLVIDSVETKNNRVHLNCICDCGNKAIVQVGALRSGNTTSCGCYQKEVVQGLRENWQEKIGKKFGSFLVLSYLGRENGKTLFFCRCDCGREIKVFAGNLQTKKSKSCGCTLSISRTLKGLFWNMHQRCENPLNTTYKYYGAKGVYISQEWCGEEGFSNFERDMGARKPGDTLDRINPFGPYGWWIGDSGRFLNCRWATRQQQGLNKRGTYRRYAEAYKKKFGKPPCNSTPIERLIFLVEN